MVGREQQGEGSPVLSNSYQLLILLLLVHPCDQGNNGDCEQNCTKKGDEAVCECGPGYKLADDKKTCEKSKTILISY